MVQKCIQISESIHFPYSFSNTNFLFNTAFITVLDSDHRSHSSSQLLKMCNVDAFDFKNDDTLLSDSYVDHECGNDFYYDDVTGDVICRHCGLVVSRNNITLNPPRSYPEQENLQHDVLQKVYKRKTYLQNDLTQCKNLYDFKRQIRREGYYSSLERKRNEVDLILRRFNKELYFQDYIVEQAWKHYIKLEKTRLFAGNRILAICSALVYISASQCGKIMHISNLVEEINNTIGELTKKEFRKAKHHIMNCSKEIGYDIKFHDIHESYESMIYTIINYIRYNSCNKTEQHLLFLTKKTKQIIEKTKHFLRYYGSLASSIPAIMYWIGKKYGIELTHKELSKGSRISSQTIKNRYLVLVEKIGKPKRNFKKKKKR